MIERFKFKGYEMLRLIDDVNQRRSIQFGVDKANLVLKEIEAIKAFAEEINLKNKAEQTAGEAIAGEGKVDEQVAQGKKTFDPFIQ